MIDLIVKHSNKSCPTQTGQFPASTAKTYRRPHSELTPSNVLQTRILPTLPFLFVAHTKPFGHVYTCHLPEASCTSQHPAGHLSKYIPLGIPGIHITTPKKTMGIPQIDSCILSLETFSYCGQQLPVPRFAQLRPRNRIYESLAAHSPGMSSSGSLVNLQRKPSVVF